MDIGKKLKELREEKGLSQAQAGEVLSCSSIVYNRYEKNRRHIPLELLAKLAIFYGVSLDYICGLEDEFGKKLYHIT